MRNKEVTRIFKADDSIIFDTYVAVKQYLDG